MVDEELITAACLQCQKPAHLQCSRCHGARYCSAACQRAHFGLHKKTCEPHVVEIVATMEFEEIQRLVSSCSKGGVVRFGPGTFKTSATTRVVDSQRSERLADGSLGVGDLALPLLLLVSKSMTVIGCCTQSTTGIESETELLFGIIVNPTKADDCGRLIIRNLTIRAEVEIKDNAFKQIELFSVGIDASATRIPGYVIRVDALGIGNCNGEKGVLLERCEIYGGWDGINNSGRQNRLYIKDCEVRFACCRGIFSNSHFVIEDSEVSNCGSYGIKDRAGRTMRGNNDIQQGPWDEDNMSLDAAEYKDFTAKLFGSRQEP